MIFLFSSVIYNLSGDRMSKSKLKHLASEFLDMQIQTGDRGHCSFEDSLACMKLVQLKLSSNEWYGDEVYSSLYSEQIRYPDLLTTDTSMLKQCVKSGNTVSVFAVEDLAKKYRSYIDTQSKESDNIACIKVDTNREVIMNLCHHSSTEGYNLNIGHIRIAEDHQSKEVFKTLDEWIGDVHYSAKEPALLAVVLSGNKNGENGVCFLQLKRPHLF